MKNKNIIKEIKEEIQRLEEILQNDAWIDERWESELWGRIDSLEWVLERL